MTKLKELINESMPCGSRMLWLRQRAQKRLAEHYEKHFVALVEALREMKDAHNVAGKQWVGLNMNVAGQKRAYEIIQAATIKAEKVLHDAENVDVEN